MYLKAEGRVGKGASSTLAPGGPDAPEVIRKVKKLSASSMNAWLKFTLNWSHGGEQMVVRYRKTGEISCSTYLDGLWHSVDVSDHSAAIRLKNLATASTSWNSVNGEYGLHSPTCIRMVRAPSTLKIRESECGCSSAVTIGTIAEYRANVGPNGARTWVMMPGAVVECLAAGDVKVAGAGYFVLVTYDRTGSDEAFPLFATPSQPRLKPLEILHLFSGPQRDGDLEHQMRKLGSELGYDVRVTNVDHLRPCPRYGGGDVCDPRVSIAILKDVTDGRYDVIHASTPCNTWTAAKYNKPTKWSYPLRPHIRTFQPRLVQDA